jgi:hypothetical protein
MVGAANGMIDDAGLEKGKTVAGFYGMAGTPEFVVVASEDSEPAGLAKDVLRAVAGATRRRLVLRDRRQLDHQ